MVLSSMQTTNFMSIPRFNASFIESMHPDLRMCRIPHFPSNNQIRFSASDTIDSIVACMVWRSFKTENESSS